jgi:hypothetical protein
MSKKELLKQNFTRCEKCKRSILKRDINSHSCGKLTYFNYRIKNDIIIESATNIKIKYKFNLTDRSILTAELEKEISEFIISPPEPEPKKIKTIRFPNDQTLNNSIVDEIFQHPQILNQIDFIDNYSNSDFQINNHQINFNNSHYESYFTKSQILHLANGVSEKKLNLLATKILNNSSITDEEWIFMIKSVENLLHTYGKEMIAEILELSPLPHCIGQVENIFNVLHQLSFSNENPMIRLRNEGMVYLLEPFVLKKVRYNQIISIKKIGQDGKTETIGHLGSNGNFYKNIKYPHPIFPTMQLILKWNNNVSQAIAYYGIDTGECSICGRKLTDKTSIKIGIGPICRIGLII